MKFIVRGYGDGWLIFEETVDMESEEQFFEVAQRQIQQIIDYENHMIEIQFPDESCFRFGNSPHGMVMPLMFILPRPTS